MQSFVYPASGKVQTEMSRNETSYILNALLIALIAFVLSALCIMRIGS